ncbi:MAG TPA: rhodanese-like domain-containing protein [Acidobacteriota bacterium]|nr:rhodanese-like domain-containing protein [Acidobacteriota bacterium]
MKAKELMESIDKFYIIDVRESDEYDSGIIPNAVKIPLSTFQQAFSCSEEEFQNTYNVRKFTKEDTLVIYCLSGARSARLCAALQSHGYNAQNLDGGLLMWPYGLQSI